MDYRKDNRSVKKFLSDIEHSTKVENEIAKRYAKYYQEKYGKKIVIIDNGCNNNGGLMRDSKVSTDADYLFNDKVVEIKFNNKKLNTFHLKTEQLRSYIKQKGVILWVNGWETKQPEFTIIRLAQLKEIRKQTKVPFKGWGNKLCYRLNKEDYNWYPF